MGCHKKKKKKKKKRTQSYRIKLHDYNDQAVRKYSWNMLYDFLLPFFSQYNVTCSIFHQGFAYHSERRLMIRERERERERGREREREKIVVCVCVCVCERERERERERENSEAFTSYFFF